MNEYLTPGEACRLIPGMTPAGLSQLRFKGTGPTFLKPTPGRVFYRRQDILAWLDNSARTQTGVAA